MHIGSVYLSATIHCYNRMQYSAQPLLEIYSAEPLLEINRQKTPFSYPYAPLIELYSSKQYFFFFTIDYSFDNTAILVHYYKCTNKTTKLLPFSFSVKDAFDNKIVSTLNIVSIAMDPQNPHLPLSITLLLGSTAGQLILGVYKEKKFVRCAQFNRLCRKEGLLSRTMGLFRSAEDGYVCWQQGPVRLCKLEEYIGPDTKRNIKHVSSFGYLVGTTLSVVRMTDEDQIAVQTIYHTLQMSVEGRTTIKAYTFDNDKQEKRCWSKDGSYLRIQFRDTVMDFLKYHESGGAFLSVVFKARVVIYALNTLNAVYSVSTDSAIRKMSMFWHEGCIQLALLPYEDYFIVVSTRGAYAKYKGHKAYCSGFFFEEGNCYVSAMDGTVSVTRLILDCHPERKSHTEWALKDTTIEGKPVHRLIKIRGTRTLPENSINKMKHIDRFIAFSFYECRVKLFVKEQLFKVQDDVIEVIDETVKTIQTMKIIQKQYDEEDKIHDS